MTLAELERLLRSKQRVRKVEAQEKATYDYILGDLIGRSMARIHSSANRYPPIEEAYPTIFDTPNMEEAKNQRKAELSALRFKQFAESFNARFKTKEGKG